MKFFLDCTPCLSLIKRLIKRYGSLNLGNKNKKKINPTGPDSPKYFCRVNTAVSRSRFQRTDNERKGPLVTREPIIRSYYCQCSSKTLANPFCLSPLQMTNTVGKGKRQKKTKSRFNMSRGLLGGRVRGRVSRLRDLKSEVFHGFPSSPTSR